MRRTLLFAHRVASLAALAITLCVVRRAEAQASTTTGFVTTLGVDTLSIERVTVTPSSIAGDVAIRNPRVRTIHFTAALDANGHVTRFDMTSQIPSAPPGPPVLERHTTIADGMVRTEVLRSGTRDTAASGSAPVGRGAVPFVQGDVAFAEQMLRQFRRSGRDSLQVPIFVFGPGHVFPTFVRRTATGDLEINTGQSFFIRADGEGRLLAMSARATTVRTETVRAPALDYTSIVDRWVAAERAGTVAGPVSARDTVVATVGGASVWVDYGRPLRRGRSVFGSLVPLDSVWRTGANAATQFRTDTDLRIGNTTIAAGTYTLWTIPTARGATLIINRQHGQWGTQYDPAQDAARIEMRAEQLRAPVEQFTIDIAPDADGAALRLTWDTRRFLVPLRPANPA